MDHFVSNFALLVCVASLAVIAWFAWRTRMPAREPGPRCPRCGYDLRASRNRCPECGTVTFDRRRYLKFLRNDWPDSPIAPREPAPFESRVLLVSTASRMESQWLEQQLRARGIACFVENVSRDLALVDTEMFYRVYVYADDADLAREYVWRAQGLPADLLDELRSRSQTEVSVTRQHCQPQQSVLSGRIVDAGHGFR